MAGRTSQLLTRHPILSPAGFAEFLGAHIHEPSPRIALAVSGGVDSTALAVIAAMWRAAGGGGGDDVALVVDHALRAASASEAALACGRLQGLGLRAEVLTCDWPPGRPPAGGTQQAARQLRYKLLAEACRREGSHALLTGHHLDDQDELFLLRLSRCSGLGGLAGMAASGVCPGEPWLPLLRPFLETPKAALRDLCLQEVQPWIEDPSNASPVYARNRVRALLQGGSGGGGGIEPAAVETRDLRRVQAACRRAREQMDAAAERLLEAAAVRRMEKGGGVELSLEPFLVQPSETVALHALCRLLSDVGRRGLPPRQRGVRLLLRRMQEFSQGKVHTGGCEVSPVTGSGRTRALIRRLVRRATDGRDEEHDA